jgi:hypothetical protein
LQVLNNFGLCQGLLNKAEGEKTLKICVSLNVFLRCALVGEQGTHEMSTCGALFKGLFYDTPTPFFFRLKLTYALLLSHMFYSAAAVHSCTFAHGQLHNPGGFGALNLRPEGRFLFFSLLHFSFLPPSFCFATGAAVAARRGGGGGGGGSSGRAVKGSRVGSQFPTASFFATLYLSLSLSLSCVKL